MLLGHIVALIAAFRASSSSEPYGKLSCGLDQLGDWLEENLESEDPSENLDAIFKQFSSLPDTLLNGGKVAAVELIRALREAAEDPKLECERAHMELIRAIQKSCQAHSTITIQRINKVLRPYVLKLVNKCDQQHEQEFEQIRSEDGAMLRPIDNMLNEAFIERHRVEFSHGVALHFRDDNHITLHRCCTPTPAELADLIRLKSIKLNADERSPRLIAPLVSRLFERNLARACSRYLERLGETFELAKSAAHFDPEGDFHFIAKRSRAYQNAVFRYKFCEHALAKRSQYINGLVDKLIEAQAPSESGRVASVR